MTTKHLSRETQLSRMTVAEAMRPGIISCPRNATLSTLASTLVTHGIHAVLVPPLNGGPLLSVSDMEIVRAAVERPEATAADIAREQMATVPIDATLDEAVEKMAIHYVTHLLATDPVGGEPLGILSSLDVAAVAGGSQPRLARMQRPAHARPSPSKHTLGQAAVRDVMHHGVVTCAPDASLSTVARTMAEHRVHCVAMAGINHVERRAQHLTWGLVADIDLLTALHRVAMNTSAALGAETEPLAVAESETLDRAAALMAEHDTAHLVVVGPTGLPSGMVSTLDVALILAANQ
ncbi:MAG: CBS domain-containing protein [Solirubrobacteraceae bacterium]